MVVLYQNRLTKASGRQIRIFVLEPAPFSSADPIRGVLIETTLDGYRKYSYDALSYVWGAADIESGPVYVDCVALSVTENCRAALRRLRDTKRGRWLWIDAVCINQADEEEKSHQVALMGDIYSSAKRVYVWLGERTENSDYALDWCVDASQDFKLLLIKLGGFPQILTPWEFWNYTRVALGWATSAVYRLRPATFRVAYRSDTMQQILSHEWFTRMWTIQELAMAKEPLMMCGGKVVSWNHLLWGINRGLTLQSNDSMINAWNSVSVAGFFWLCLFEKQVLGDEHIQESYRWALSTFDAGNPRKTVDRIHVVQNITWLLVTAQLCYVVMKRYDRSVWRLNDTDIDAWVLSILVVILIAIMLLTPPRDNFSWEQHLRRGLIRTLNKTRARNATDPRDKVFALFGVLTALGIKLDDPDYGDSATAANVFLQFTRRLIEWHNSLDILVEASSPAPAGAPTWVPDWSRPNFREDVSQYKAAGDSAPDFILHDRFLETSGKVLDQVDKCFHEPRRRLTALGISSDMAIGVRYKTKGGRNGDGPGSIRTDDVLVLISGLCVPMLVRRSGPHFEVVGPAFVDGIMQGEAWPIHGSQLDRLVLL